VVGFGCLRVHDKGSAEGQKTSRIAQGLQGVGLQGPHWRSPVGAFVLKVF
jgi:hypothetical protein